jgi:hypothetical protein
MSNVDNLSLSLNQPLPLSLCHCQPVTCQPVQPVTCHNNLYHASIMHQPVPQPCTINQCINHAPTLYLNLYHQQVHQPCTNTTCTTMSQQNNNNLSQQHISSISSTKSDLLTKINHQDNSQPYAQYHQDVHQPRLLTNINKMYHNQYVLLKVYQYIYATSSINHVPTILLASASNNVPSMYQSCINNIKL